MPFTLLAHQAPVLPLKRRWPERWSLTALCIGSMAPDLEYIPRGPTGASFAHSWLGQVAVCLPLAGVASLLALGLSFPALGRRFGFAAPAPTDLLKAPSLLRIAVSSFVGSSSHVVLDELTHAYGWPARTWPLLRRPWAVGPLRFTGTLWLQYSVSLVLGAFTFWALAPALRRGARHLRSSSLPPAQRRELAAVAASTTIAGALAARHALRFYDNARAFFVHPSVYAMGYVAFVTFMGAAAACLLATASLGAWDRRLHRDRP